MPQLVLFIALGLVVFALCIVIFRYLWNTTMPQVFGVKEIGFWTAFRLLLIAGFLFGSGMFRFTWGK